MSTAEKEDLIKKLDEALDSIRPHLKVDGGNIEVVDITDEMIAQVKWMGNCEFCSMTAMTMKAGIQETVRQQMPEIKGVVAINGPEVSQN